MLTQKTIGYHGTLSTFSEKILKDGFNLPEPSIKHNHWLGHGVYFFDNYFNAAYWSTTKSDSFNKKCSKKTKYDPAVLQATLEAEISRISNLDNPEEAIKYNTSIIRYENIIKSDNFSVNFSEGLNPNSSSYYDNIKARVSCYYHDLYANDNNLSIMMYTFHKKNPKYSKKLNELRKKSSNSFLPMIEYNEKQICVYDLSVITCVNLIDNEGDEIC